MCIVDCLFYVIRTWRLTIGFMVYFLSKYLYDIYKDICFKATLGAPICASVKQVHICPLCKKK